MKTKQVKFWMSESKSFIVLNLNKECDEGEVKESINEYYQEYINPDEAGVDAEMLDEIESVTPFRWIFDHMCDREEFDVDSASRVFVSDDVAKIIDYLTEKIAENREYYEESDDCDGHDAGVVMEAAQDVLDFIEKEIVKNIGHKPPVMENPNLRKVTIEEFMALKAGDAIYHECGCSPCFSKMLVTRAPFWNSDADEPGWEVETTNGFYDMYSLYVAVADYPQQGEH